MSPDTEQTAVVAVGVALEQFAGAVANHGDVTVIDGQMPARSGGETMKDVAGYDTKRLYISGHGAFGALTSLIFKVTVKP
ncbi:hypothetical protein MHIB_03740 [Mycolicibacter hiberniae]|uniref:Uncharacterized protein n=1 Tax=Mycolicibacter hiberniae TaxID=29314 RepID=A0A7I7WWI3_9MYCO|nr:hypothetical protein [Mycolicibacter hiberniae]BBZ21956.1 hypothetical protein MHIB_03740 [Mycolicibacter hiberniae]